MIDTKTLTVAPMGDEITEKCLKTAEILRKIAEFSYNTARTILKKAAIDSQYTKTL